MNFHLLWNFEMLICICLYILQLSPNNFRLSLRLQLLHYSPLHLLSYFSSLFAIIDFNIHNSAYNHLSNIPLTLLNFLLPNTALLVIGILLIYDMAALCLDDRVQLIADGTIL